MASSMRNHWQWFFLYGALLLAGCSVSSLDNLGGSSGTEVSALAGSAVASDGKPLAFADVRLRPASYLPDSLASPSYAASHSIIDTITDQEGRFRFGRLVSGDYHIEIILRDSLGVLAETRVDGSAPVRLDRVVAMPLACLVGNVQVNYSNTTDVTIQVFGMQRSVTPDSLGNFWVNVPEGRHSVHIAAYAPDSIGTGWNYDGFDVTLQVVSGESKDIGSFRLKPPPPPPCPDGTCDSMVVRSLLDAVGLRNVSRNEVMRVENGRVVELNFRGRNLSAGIPPEINKLVALRVLDLGQTGLPNMFPDMGRMSALEIVRLDGNHIPFFSSTIGNLTGLRELDLYGNDLTALPESILRLSGLSYMNVGANRLCAVDQLTTAWIDGYDSSWRTSQRCQ